MSNRLASKFVADLSCPTGRATQNHMKKELMDICKCSDKTLEQIVSSLNIEVNFDIQNHLGQACPD